MEKTSEIAFRIFIKAIKEDEKLGKTIVDYISTAFCDEWHKNPLTVKVFNTDVRIDPLKIEEAAKVAANNFITLITSI